MSEFNFDKMQNIDIPDEWAEKTIQKAKSIKVINFSEHFRFTKIALIASVLFFLIATVFTFALEESNVGIDSTNETQNIKSTESSNSSVYALATEETQEETELNSVIAQTDSVTDDEIKTNNNHTSKETQPVATENDSDVDSDISQNGGQSSTEDNESDKYNYSVKAVIDNSKLKDSSEIYCKVYNSGMLVGSSDLFSEQHKAEIVEKNDTSTVFLYYPYKNNVVVNGTDPLYIFTFYNEYGVDVYTCAVSLNY